MSFGTGLLYDILSDIMRSIVDHIGFLISDIYSYAVEINNTAQVSAACTYTMLLGAALCTLAVTADGHIWHGNDRRSGPGSCGDFISSLQGPGNHGG